MRKSVLLILAVLITGASFAQARRVSGTVTNENGEPITGAAVSVQGTNAFAVTDADGNYSIAAPADGTLVVRLLGMSDAAVAIGSRSVVDVRMATDAKLIEDVLVVAYGTATKESLTSAVSSISSKDIEKRISSSVTSTLEGAAPGIQVNSTYGEPGSNPTIRVRGFGSINGNNDPLYVVDGTIFAGGLSDLNPGDIQSISVLKDAASAALYGNRAANGVVVITTKKGRSNRLNVQLNTKQGVYVRGVSEYDRIGADPWMETMYDLKYNDLYDFHLADKKDPMTPEQAAAAAHEETGRTLIDGNIKRNIYDAANDKLFDANGKIVARVRPGYTDLDWNKGVQQTGYRGEYNLQADVAGEKYDFFASLGYLDENGYVKNNNYERISGRMATNFTPNKWFKAGITVAGTTQFNDYRANAYSTYYANPFMSARMKAPVYPMFLHKEDGSFLLDADGNKQYDLASEYLGNRNIAYELRNDFDRRGITTFNSSAYATISFLKDFQFTVKGSTDRRNSINKRFNNAFIGDGATNGGRLSKTYYKYGISTFQQQLTYTRDFARGHHVDVFAGHENYDWKREYDYVMDTKQSVPIPEFGAFTSMSSIEGYSDVYRTESYLGRARYNYKNRYFGEASIRRDGSSRFHPSHRWGNFWSVGGSWVISGEEFMKNVEAVDYLKLRASYGEVGNDQSAGYYAYQTLYGLGQNGGQAAMQATLIGATALKWEATQSFDVGVDGRFWDRLNVTVDFFNKVSRDLIYKEQLPQSVGTLDPADANPTITRNFGSVKNYGLELDFNVEAVKTRNWNWNVGLNATFARNEIMKLPGGKGYMSDDNMHRMEQGHSMYEFYLYQYAGVDRMTGAAMYELDPDKRKDAEDADGITTINGRDYVVSTSFARRDWSGNALPVVYGGLSTVLSWKNLTFNALFTYSLGGKVYDSNYRRLMFPRLSAPEALHPDILKCWKEAPAGMTADSANRLTKDVNPRNNSGKANDTYSASDRWLVDASYFVVKNVGLSYEFPRTIVERIGVGGLTVSASVENPLTITARKGLNPQYKFDGTQDLTYVTARIFTLGVSLKL